MDAVLCLVAQSCPTLCDPVDCSLPTSSVHGVSPGKNTGVGCHALLQGIFSTQGSNPGLPHCRWILYQLSHQGSPIDGYWAGSFHIGCNVCLCPVIQRMFTPGSAGRVTLTSPALIPGHRPWVPWLCVKLVSKFGGGWEGLLLGRKVMSNLDSILKSRDITCQQRSI